MTESQTPFELHASFRLERRAFLGALALAAGGVAVGTLVPAPLSAAACSTPSVGADPCGDWSIDDMWGAYPPYSHPIPYGRPRMEMAVPEGVDPIDLHFIT